MTTCHDLCYIIRYLTTFTSWFSSRSLFHKIDDRFVWIVKIWIKMMRRRVLDGNCLYSLSICSSDHIDISYIWSFCLVETEFRIHRHVMTDADKRFTGKNLMALILKQAICLMNYDDIMVLATIVSWERHWKRLAEDRGFTWYRPTPAFENAVIAESVEWY